MSDQDAIEQATEEFTAAVEKYIHAVQDHEPSILSGYLLVYSRSMIEEDSDQIGYISSRGMSMISKLGLAEALHLRARHWFEDDD